MPKNERDDIDLATAAEQSSEVEETQEGSTQTADEASVDSAEHEALSIDDESGSSDVTELDELLDTLDEAKDEQADAIVEDALHIDSLDEAEAAVEATDDEAELDAEELQAEGDAAGTFNAVTESEQTVQDADVEAAFGADESDVVTEEVEDEAEVDPYEAFRYDLRGKPGKWYVIHSYAGFERRVKQNIENRMVSLTMEDFIYQIEVPMEDVVEIKNGQRKLVTRVRIPGYVLVRMDLNEDSWSVVRHTPGVTGFVGNAHNPTPLRFEEAFNMLKSLVQVQEAAPAAKGSGKAGKAAQRVIPAEVDFEIGETITIKEGSFAGLPGTINEIKPESGKLTVLVSLFERETPVELSFDQVTKL
ncbi:MULTISPECIES: transcription termination/antitermination protein NusG [unclassified Frondihabitans]|uniref:transcription termination/antitermination protein NusG n=1 Tax=unclassified Frondihabitans TaxID=2626248 RepID=UPI000F4E3DE3|nr:MULTISPECIES: transcription termination/antitermination protein NusG [unclassified Frondihabitans]RPE78898.1 transcription antitermination protein nusG [Frondihabitans sp. PhB153]RPF09179.1 transcription antitermination protein nusG [Frondihabitans sp. PhB161]